MASPPAQDGDEEQTEAARLFQCSYCQAQFHRADHLVRHVRKHTKQRPYICSYCGKCFSRRDLVKRHEEAHEVNGPVDLVALSRMPERVGQACLRCAAKKAKCSEEKPCRRCVDSGNLCEYEQSGASTRVVPMIQQQPPRQGAPEGGQLESPVMNIGSVTTSAPSLELGTSTEGYDEVPNLSDFSTLVPSSTAEISFGTHWDMHTIDLSIIQQSFLPQAAPQDLVSYPMLSNAGSWDPEPSDNSEIEHPNLALREPVPDNGHARMACSTPSLSTGSRDKILHMILGVTSPANASGILSSFPSVEALNNMIGLFVRRSNRSYIDDFIHLPTLRLDEQEPELLAMLAAMGALEANTPALRKFGYAMQEIWEESHQSMRNISICQAFLLQQYIATYSAVKRKIMLAAACSKCLSLFIRIGSHETEAVGVLQPDHLDIESDEDLVRAWYRWSKTESRRRLIYTAYIMDAHSSMAHGQQAVYSFLDIEVPPPQPAYIWQAATPRRWREARSTYQQSLNTIPLSIPLQATIFDPTILVSRESQIDSDFGMLAFLGGIWGFVKECSQLANPRFDRGVWSSLLLGSRQAEIASVLQVVGPKIASGTTSLGVKMLHTVLSMHIYASATHLHMYPRTQASALPSSSEAAGNWLDSADCRPALWLAGRVLRVARKFSQGMLRDIYAVSVFQAATVLWYYGHLSGAHARSSSVHQPRSVVALDADETTEMDVKRKNSEPALLGLGKTAIRLTSLPSMMELVREILHQNWTEGLMPQGTEEICLALENLVRASQPSEAYYPLGFPTSVFG
ncbi:uncharacterized protein JN550_012828 [Neoarthrinium moseri]|uniref:uncharacterized protein n=1 Tax=Neoarthrinium moseri TaxID=1658444 RepID=UPI001FDBD30F|nr:uncharacterized protein JN550_012828 [Neoarthrinium moseri]KAI1858297.1 hypothetical protein JN550_012828 [Neoarthrinium moseri]